MGVPNTEVTPIAGTITGELPDGASNLGQVRYTPSDVVVLAAAGSTLATGAAVTKHMNYVTGANGANGVTLPAINVGESYLISNASASTLSVWPNSSTISINAAAGGTAFTISSANAGFAFTGVSASQIGVN